MSSMNGKAPTKRQRLLKEGARSTQKKDNKIDSD
jgi:hypothetical protein